MGLFLCGVVFGQGLGSKNKVRKLKITVLEDDGTPSDFVRYISFDNGNVTISGDTAYVASTSLAFVTESGDTLLLAPTYFKLFGVEYDSATIADDDIWKYDAGSGKFVLEADATGGAGSGSVTTLKENDVQVGGADIVTVDFLGADFDLAESPDTEVQIIIAAAITRDSEAAAAYQPLEATLTDFADGILNENIVNTDNPWAENEIIAAVMVEGENATLLDGTNWRLFYVNGSGDVTELVLGADGTFLESNGAAAAPAFRVLAAGDIPDISATYEVQLNNEAGLYAVLSDVADYVQGGEVNSIDSDMYVDDSIDDAHINWGTGAGQISLKDIDPTPDDWWTFTVDSANGLTADTTWFERNDFGATITIDSIYVRSDEDDYGITFLECDYEGGNIQTIDAVTASTNGAGMYYITETTISHSSIEVGHQVGFPRPSSTHDALMLKVFFHYTRP